MDLGLGLGLGLFCFILFCSVLAAKELRKLEEEEFWVRVRNAILEHGERIRRREPWMDPSNCLHLTNTRPVMSCYAMLCFSRSVFGLREVL